MRIAPLVWVALAAAGCAAPSSQSPSAPGATATARLEPTKGNSTAGTVSFAQRGGKVLVTANVSGLKPNAEHGFHVHEKGDCSSGDGMSAGGHFNPAGKPHGMHTAPERHVGDMPNLRADASGNAKASFEVSGMEIGNGAADIVGKGLIVHRDPDDYKSQPAGNAGPRLACAVIRRG
ncbi:MAG TPA: superoxide dismutase family protein [Usitatibacter sp.]|nr:superoxide dismutase family protein [Usitatibacter sp.]